MFVVLVIMFIGMQYLTWEIHGNRQWSVVMLVLVSITVFLAVMFLQKRLTVAAVVGYPVSFFFGTIFSVDSFDPGGGLQNNWWSLWALSYLGIILFTVIGEIIVKKVKKNGKRN